MKYVFTLLGLLVLTLGASAVVVAFGAPLMAFIIYSSAVFGTLLIATPHLKDFP